MKQPEFEGNSWNGRVAREIVWNQFNFCNQSKSEAMQNRRINLDTLFKRFLRVENIVPGDLGTARLWTKYPRTFEGA